MKEVGWLKATPPLPLQYNSHDSYKRCNQVLICFTSSLQWVLRGYNSSLWGKLYSEWHLTPQTGAVCCNIALLPPCWLPDIFVRCRAEPQKPERPRCGALGSVLLHAPPPSATAQCHYAANTSNYKEPCGTCGGEQTKKTSTGYACALAKAASMSWQSHTRTRCLLAKEKPQRAEIRKLWTPLGVYVHCPLTN